MSVGGTGLPGPASMVKKSSDQAGTVTGPKRSFYGKGLLVMTKLTTVISIPACAAVIAIAGPGALAQTGRTQLAQVQPAAASSTWKCAFSVVELAPVSEDTGGRPTAWVMVHRIDGEVVAAERVSLREVEQIRALPCGRKPDSGPPLVG